MANKIPKYTEIPGRRTEPGRSPMQLAACLILFAMLTCTCWLAPGSVSAATDTYYYQDVAPTSVCVGSTTGVQTSAANVPATGGIKYVYPLTSGTYVHVTALDMYTVAYTSPMTITQLSLSLSYSYSHSLYLQAQHLVYAKFYDVDANAPCPPSEKGTLIAQTPINTWYRSLYGDLYPGLQVSGLLYNMLPGHRIRVEIWNYVEDGTLSIMYGPGTITGLVTTETPTVADTCTVGPGVDPPAASISAGEPETPLDSFTLQTSAGADAINQVTVTLTADSWKLIDKIAVKSDDGSVTYGTVSNPDYDIVRIPLTTAITATTTPVQYKIWITPRLLDAMPAPVGATYPVWGTVTQLDSAYTKVYNDTTSATVTVTNQGGPGTVTIGDAPSPVNTTIGYSSSPADLDVFTLRATRTNNVTGVTVSLAPGTAEAIGSLMIKGGTVGASDYNTTYGYVSNPASDTVQVTGMTIPLTGSPIALRISISSKRNPPAPLNYPVTGTVTDVTMATAPDAVIANDTTSATVTIDNYPPAAPTVVEMVPGDSQLRLCWNNQPATDFRATLVLVNTVPITDVPVKGVSYSRYSNNMVGTSRVVYYGYDAGTMCEYAYQLANSTPHYVRFFAEDKYNNYSAPLDAGPLTPMPTVEVKDGVNPSNATLAPGGAGVVDNFTLGASISGASVTGVTVSLSPGAAAKIKNVRIVGADGVATYGTVTDPATDSVLIPTSALALPSNSMLYTPVSLNVEITAKPHAEMTLPPGEETRVTGHVTAVTTTTASNTTYADATSATLTVDNLSPGNPAAATAVPMDGGFLVSWSNPGDADFSSILVLRSTVALPDSPAEGALYQAGTPIGSTSTAVYAGSGQSFIERGLTNGATYYYRFYALDTRGNYSTGTGVGPLQPQPNAKTVAGSASAIIQGLDAIAVTMPYTDDSNGNGTCGIEYKLSSASTWTPWPGVIARSTANCTATVTGLAAGSRYDVRMTYNDSDGILGKASQTVNGIVALSLIQTAAGTVTASFSDSSTIAVTAPFTNDYNQNNSCLIEFKRSADNAWTVWTTVGPAAGPYSAFIGGLQPLVKYDVRVTYVDPDGVNGAAVQVIAGLVSPSAKNLKLTHNSLNANKKNYWSQYGGWGVPWGQYGEFTCMTCHDMRTPNAAGVKTVITLKPLPQSITPDSNWGGPVTFVGSTGPSSFGDDSSLTVPRQGSTRICQVCHTQTIGRGNKPIHRAFQNYTANHANSNGKDCTRCHTHDTGFKSPF